MAEHRHNEPRHDEHAHDHRPSRGEQERALVVALAANGAFFAVEIVGGFVFRSLALLADAAHMVSDVAGLAIALVAHRLVSRPATARHSYGLQRSEVLAAQANGLALVAVAAGIVVVAVHRIGTPVAVVGPGLLTVATAGLVVNVVSARTLHGSMGANLNVRAAFIHMVSDAAGSVAAIVAGIGVVVWNARGVDPVASIVIAVLVLWSAFRLLRDTAHVLLEGTPRGMDPTSVERALAADDAVEAVHHLHLWNLASDVPALSAHVVLRGEVTLHDAQEHGNRLKRVLIAEFGIEHTTLELECHPCDEPATFVPPT